MLAFSPSGEFSEEYSDGVSEPDMSPKLRSASLAAGAPLRQLSNMQRSFALVGHFGKDSNKIIRRALHGIVSELENPTPARQKTLIVSSTALTMCFYLVTGAAGYIRFGNATQDNILLGYVHQSRSETLALICSSQDGHGGVSSEQHGTGNVPMQVRTIPSFFSLFALSNNVMYPCRLSMHQLLKDFAPDSWSCLRSISADAFFNGETLAILAGAYIISVLLPDIHVAFGLTGAITGCALVYILPPAFYLKLCCNDGGISAIALLTIGSILSVTCTVAMVINLIMDPGGQ